MNNSTNTPPVCSDPGMINGTSDDTKQWQYTWVDIIQLYIFPIVFILGWINNAIAIAVLLSKTYRKTSTGFLMIALAVADFGVVSTGLLRKWIIALTQYDLRLASSASCRIHNFFTYSTVSISSWSLAIIAIERTICVCNPLRCKEIASRKRIYSAWIVCFLVICGIQSNFLWTHDLYYDVEYCMVICAPTAEFKPFHNGGMFEWIDLVMSSLGPFGVMLPCNVIIITKIVKSRSQRQAMSNSKNSKGISSTTIMLTVTSVLFFVLTAPMAFFLLILSYFYRIMDDFADAEFIFTIFYLLFNLNSSINFLLYCASGTKFRRTLKMVFCPLKRPTSASQPQSSSATQVRGSSLRSSAITTHDSTSHTTTGIATQSNSVDFKQSSVSSSDQFEPNDGNTKEMVDVTQIKLQ